MRFPIALPSITKHTHFRRPWVTRYEGIIFSEFTRSSVLVCGTYMTHINESAQKQRQYDYSPSNLTNHEIQDIWELWDSCALLVVTRPAIPSWLEEHSSSSMPTITCTRRSPPRLRISIKLTSFVLFQETFSNHQANKSIHAKARGGIRDFVGNYIHQEIDNYQLTVTLLEYLHSVSASCSCLILNQQRFWRNINIWRSSSEKTSLFHSSSGITLQIV